MSEINLSEYHRQIDRLIEDSRLSEAVAHCRHILEEYPRHIPTYRLLGKAYLEQQKGALATEMFQRVLSAQPDDLVAHVGLGLTHKSNELLEPAIWHIERAYELDPYNPAIQQELRGLYQTRGGPAPDQLTLTPGALARLHARCELYPQAISAARKLIAADPTRIDVKQLLAEALWRDDQRIDAVAVCREILDQLPNCIVAHAILAEVWLLSGQEEDGRRHLEHVVPLTLPSKETLDPESVLGIAFGAKGAPPLPPAIRISTLDTAESALIADEADSSPDWIAALTGAAAQDEKAGEDWADDVPDIDWFRNADTDLPHAESEELPDWLQQISAEVGSEIFAISEEIVAEGAAEAEADKAAGTADEEAPEVMADIDSMTSDLAWFTGGLDPANEEAGSDFADWLQDTLADYDSGEMADEQEPASAFEPDMDLLDNLPDWLTDDREAPPAEPTATDYLAELVSDDPGDLPDEDAPEGAEEDLLDDAWVTGEMPSWMAEPEAEAELQLSVTDWLDEIRPDAWEPEDAGAAADGDDAEISGMPGVAAGAVPDWLHDDKVSAAQDDAGSDAGEMAAEGSPTPWVSDELADLADDADFLRQEMSAAAADLADTVPTEVEVESGSTSEEDEPAVAGTSVTTTDGDAMQKPDDPEMMSSEESQEQGAAQDPAASTPSESAAKPAVPPEDSDTDIPDWLQLDVEAELASAELPDWLQPPSSEAGDALPDWLRTPTRIDPATDSATDAAGAEDAPAWPEEVEDDGGLDWLDRLAAGAGDALDEPPTLQWLDDADAVTDDVEADLTGELGEAEVAAVADAVAGAEADDEADDLPEDPEEAMAWLEMLAARQGAPREELPSLSAEEAATDARSEEAPPALDEEALDEEIPEDPEEAMAWLERLAARQGAPLEELPSLSEREFEDEEVGPAADLSEPAVEETETLEAASEEPVVDALELPADAEAAQAWLEHTAAEGEYATDLPPLTASPEEGERGLTEELAAMISGAPRLSLEAADEPDMLDEDIPEDPEAAMAWLEQLAARQGAPLDELPSLTEAPAEGAEGMTDELTAASAGEPRFPADEIEDSAELTGEIPQDPEAAMAWLEELAARQGAPLEELPSQSDREEEPGTSVSPADMVAVMPQEPDAALAWLQGLSEGDWPVADESGISPHEDEDAATVAESPMSAADAEAEAVPSDMPESDELASDVPQEPEAALAWLVAWAQLDDDVSEIADQAAPEPDADAESDLVEALAAEGLIERAFEGPPVEETPELEAAEAPESETTEAPESDAKEAPEQWDWLSESAVDAEEPDLDTWTDLEGEEGPDLTMAVDLVGEVEDAMPDWLAAEADTDTSWLDELPAAPDAEPWSPSEPTAAPDPSEDTTSIADESSADEEDFASEEELLPAVEQEAPSATGAPVETLPAKEEPDAAVPLPAAEAEPSSALTAARAALAGGELSEAIERYGALIRDKEALSAVVADLEAATSGEAPPPLLQRLLGDAYAEQGDLQKAIDLYRRAMDQL